MLSSEPFPNLPGCYLLLLYLPRRQTIVIGKRGPLSFTRGWYLYAGSAFGRGGLRARLGHHLSPLNSYHWHIDYLRDVAGLRAVWFLPGSNKEHLWSAALSQLPDASLPVRGFGSSDCRCFSHLVYLPSRPSQKQLRLQLGNQPELVCKTYK